jgi:hypothetical protein
MEILEALYLVGTVGLGLQIPDCDATTITCVGAFSRSLSE